MREFHCADLAVEAVRAASGRDVWAELGGRPRDWREAAALYRRLGALHLAEAVTAVLGAPIPPLRARRGDIALVRSGGGAMALGVVRGELVECLGGTVPIGAVVAAWSAPRGRRKPR